MLWIKLDPEDSSLTVDDKFLFGTTTFGLWIRQGKYFWGPNNQVNAPPVDYGDPGSWVHLCGQYNADKRWWYFYRNSQLMASNVGSGPIDTDSTWYIGGRPDLAATTKGVQFRGIWLFGSTISISNLQTLYISATGDVPPIVSSDKLIGYWPLDQGSGSVASDCSGVCPIANGSFIDPSIEWGLTQWSSNIRFVDTSQSIQAVIRDIKDASRQKPYRIYIGVGDYTEQIILKPWITLIGCGEGLTTLKSSDISMSPFGSLVLANETTVRQLDIVNMGKSSDLQVCGIEASTNLIKAQIEYVTISCNGQTFNVPVKAISVMKVALNSKITLNQCTLNSKGGVADTVVVNHNAALIMENCIIQSLSPAGSASVGLISTRSSTILKKCQIASPNVAVLAQVGATILLDGCQAQGPRGSLITSSNGEITANQCQISGQARGNVIINP